MLDAAKFAQENECLFFESSALTCENIEESFTKLATTIKHKVEDGFVPEEFVLTKKREVVIISEDTKKVSEDKIVCYC